MFDLHDVRDVIFYDKDGNKLFKFDKVASLNIDMSVSAGEAMEFDCHITSYGFDAYKPYNITAPINESTYVIPTAEGNKPVKMVYEDRSRKILDEALEETNIELEKRRKILEDALEEANKLEQEKKEAYDYYFGDVHWKEEENNLCKPVLTKDTKKVGKYKELFGGDKEWLL